MEWETVGGSTMYINPAKLEAGTEIIGVFEKTFIQNGRFGQKIVHEIATPEGAKLLNGTGQLNKSMGFLEPGDTVKIVYHGKKMLETGERKGTMAHQWQVQRGRKPNAAEVTEGLSKYPEDAFDSEDRVPF